jgi:hypothetical protein
VISLALYLRLLASIAAESTSHVSADVTASLCETVGPRLDGLRVTICDGSVVSFSDAHGNTVRKWKAPR